MRALVRCVRKLLETFVDRYRQPTIRCLDIRSRRRRLAVIAHSASTAIYDGNAHIKVAGRNPTGVSQIDRVFGLASDATTLFEAIAFGSRQHKYVKFVAARQPFQVILERGFQKGFAVWASSHRE